MRLIDEEGGQVGIVPVEQALELAKGRNLDLVEIAPDSQPPVCKLMNYGKYRYELQRAARENKKKQHNVQVKEVKFRPGIAEHDYDSRRVMHEGFLKKGTK